MSSRSTILLLGDRVLVRCDDGALDAEHALFAAGDFVAESGKAGGPGAGYVGTAGRALARLEEEGASAELSHEAACSLDPDVIISFARSMSVREVARRLGPFELFEGGEYVADGRYYRGTWLDLRALGLAMRLDGAAVAMQALHLAAALAEVPLDTPMFLSTPAERGPLPRTHPRIDLRAVFALPNALKVLRPNPRPLAPDMFEDRRRMRASLAKRIRACAPDLAGPGPQEHFDALETALSDVRTAGMTSTVPPPLPPVRERPSSRPPIEKPSTPPAQARWGPMILMPADHGREILVDAPAAPTPQQGPLDRRLVLLTEPNSDRSASFRLLRDNLIAKGLPRVLAVSSAATHDGKTTCAVNLALALAEQEDTKVLLVDANFYDPELAAIFSIDTVTPIAKVNRGLHVAAIARRANEPPPRFDSEKFDMFIARLARSDYDYILIDAPALAGSPVVRQLVAVADATLLAVRSGETTARGLRRAIDQVPKSKAIGVALMDSDPAA